MKRFLAIPITAAILAIGLTGCGKKDPLAIACSGFLNKDAASQLTLATQWGAPNRGHIGPAEKLVGPTYQKDLLGYCPAHPNVMLKDISLRLGQ